jgi:cytochrome c553
MRKSTLLHTSLIFTLSVLMLSLSGCSIFANRPAADTAAATERTAYLTCGGCHGPKNVRVSFMSPNILGQKKGYLAEKLRDFRDMKRVHPAMNGVVEKLTDQDIVNLAAYYANYGQNKN